PWFVAGGIEAMLAEFDARAFHRRAMQADRVAFDHAARGDLQLIQPLNQRWIEESTDLGHLIKGMSRELISPAAAGSGAVAGRAEPDAKSRPRRPRRSPSRAAPRPASAVWSARAALVSLVVRRVRLECFDTSGRGPAHLALDRE